MKPSLTTIARRLLTKEAMVSGTLLAAVSGGPDSMAMLDVLATLAPRLGFTLAAHGVDHGLRAEAAAELDLARTLAERRGVAFGVTTLAVAKGANLQARARAARREVLAAVATSIGAGFIATAHHADDRAETFLLRLLRGAGPAGLAVLPPSARLGPGIQLVRPLLRARRSDVMAHLERRKIDFATDPSNLEPRYLRTRVRSELLPLMAALGPGIVSHLEALADQLQALREHEDAPGSAIDRTLALPRATQLALRDLLASGSRTGRVTLPGGLVVSAGPPCRRK